MFATEILATSLETSKICAGKERLTQYPQDMFEPITTPELFLKTLETKVKLQFGSPVENLIGSRAPTCGLY